MAAALMEWSRWRRLRAALLAAPGCVLLLLLLATFNASDAFAFVAPAPCRVGVASPGLKTLPRTSGSPVLPSSHHGRLFQRRMGLGGASEGLLKGACVCDKPFSSGGG